MNRLDEFFKEKLYHHQKEAPGSAWDKINAQLDKPVWYESWWKVAAAVLLVCLASVTIWKFSSQDKNEFMAKNSEESATNVKQDSIEKTGKADIEPSEKQPEPIAQKNDHQIEKQVEKKSSPPKVKVLPPTSDDPATILQQQIAAQPSSTKEDTLLYNSIAATENTERVNEVVDDSPTIILTKEEVNQKYLRKKTTTEATPEEENPSTLKKLLDKAYALKHNQDPVGELRQKKDEILALNFNKEKRSQNR